MVRVSYLFWVLMGFVVLVGCQSASQSDLLDRSDSQVRLVRESIEWCNIWLPNADKNDKPRVLIVGDSITVGYFPGVEKRIAEKAYCGRLSTSRCVSDPVFFDELNMVLKQYPFEVIHFNNGLHGWGYTEEDYEAGLEKLIRTLKQSAPNAKLIWAHSTATRNKENLAHFGKNNRRVQNRNAIAQRLMDQAGIPINDLYAPASKHQEYFSKDGVHFNNQGKTNQAEQAAEMILSILDS